MSLFTVDIIIEARTTERRMFWNKSVL